MPKHPKKLYQEMSDEEVIELIAEEVLNNARKIQSEEADPFEVYAYHVQAKIFADTEFFKDHCLQGYRSLIKKL